MHSQNARGGRVRRGVGRNVQIGAKGFAPGAVEAHVLDADVAAGLNAVGEQRTRENEGPAQCDGAPEACHFIVVLAVSGV